MKNVVSIEFEKLRKYHHGCYGYTPISFIEKISESIVRFGHPANRPLSSWSFPSMSCGCHEFYCKENYIHSYFPHKDVGALSQKLKNLREMWVAEMPSSEPISGEIVTRDIKRVYRWSEPFQMTNLKTGALLHFYHT